MRRKGKLSTKQKVDICKQYLNGEKSASELSHDFDISDITIRRWSKKYQSLGSGCFNIKPHNAKYTKEFKQQVVEAYLAGEVYLNRALDLRQERKNAELQPALNK